MTAALSRESVRRIACAVVAYEVRRLRGADLPMPHDWPECVAIGEDGLGLDSLERLAALGALAETFVLDDALLSQEPPRSVRAWVDWIMRQHSSNDSRITVMTSGSTGRPQPCPHTVATLVDEARFLATQVHGRQRVVTLVPAHHLYGIIWTALLPAILNAPVVTREIGRPLDLVSGDLIVAVPDQWRAILRLTRGFEDDVVGVSSAGPLEATLAADLLRLGLTRLLDIYGSSETGGIAVRELPETVYELLPRWRLLPLGSGDWQLGDDQGECHRLPDHIEHIDERHLRPSGRRDGAVKVGGHNVRPEQVADMLRSLDGVTDAAVRLHTNGRLKAFIVPDDGCNTIALADRIESAVTNRLSVYEQPRSLRFGDVLPHNSMGKLEDWV